MLMKDVGVNGLRRRISNNTPMVCAKVWASKQAAISRFRVTNGALTQQKMHKFGSAETDKFQLFQSKIAEVQRLYECRE